MLLGNHEFSNLKWILVFFFNQKSWKGSWLCVHVSRPWVVIIRSKSWDWFILLQIEILGLVLCIHMVLWLVPSCLSLRPLPAQQFVTGNVLSAKCRRIIRWKCTTRPGILPCVRKDRTGLRVFVLSDLHTDYSENMTWVKHISIVTHKKDVLLVAGDVAETFKNFVQTMSLLKDRFEHVFYVPGNHDLWCRWEKEEYVRNDFLGLHFWITCWFRLLNDK